MLHVGTDTSLYNVLSFQQHHDKEPDKETTDNCDQLKD